MKNVATFSKPEDAHLLCAHLEGSGIPAFVRDGQTVSTDWALSNAIGGVKVEVADEYYDAALAVVSAFATPSDASQTKNKGHSFTRYVKLFGILFASAYTLTAAVSSPASAGSYGSLLLPVAGICACLALCCAVLDL